MRQASFDFFAGYLKASSGLILQPDQAYLLEARLASLLELYACADMDALAQRLKYTPTPDLAQLVRDAMATHETFFFRDMKIFDALPRLLHERQRTRQPSRIWSAGCSAGQEPYSLAMLLQDVALPHDIVASDLSLRIVQQARLGLYSHFESQRGLPVRYLLRHFTQEGLAWRLDETIRNDVSFHCVNLLDDFSHLGAFDAVFCRNVLMYLDAHAKKDILRRLHQTLVPGGLLILGTVETPDDPARWRQVDALPGVYERV